jgi:gamma-glutamyltranspeptidase / glutathione hydrolase
LRVREFVRYIHENPEIIFQEMTVFEIDLITEQATWAGKNRSNPSSTSRVSSIVSRLSLLLSCMRPLATRFSTLASSLLLLFLFLFLLLLPPSQASAQVGWPKGYDNGVVSSATWQSSQVGVDIMKKGGNAVDAAIAVQFALAVTFPAAGNIGGGGFMVVREPDGKVATLDFREMAPASSTETMYQNPDGTVIDGLSLTGHLASGVPGSVDGMVQAWERYGTLPWADLLEPAIRLARDGFELGWQEANSLNRNRARFEAFPGSKQSFVKNNDDLWAEGDILKQAELAATLERIAAYGRDGFYAGETAKLIVEEMNRGRGIISMQDLQNYRSVWRDPLLITYRDYKLITMGPPSSGGVAMAQILGMLEPYDLNEMGFNSASSIHVIAESMRRAYADRAEHLGDPDFYPVPVKGLLDSDYLKRRMSSFRPDAATLSSDISHGSPAPSESEETTHFSVVDPKGMAVAITTTLNGGYGSWVTVQGAGFLLNNEMDDFSIKPGTPNMYGLLGGRANAIEPGKRMLSSMTPTIVEQNGELRMVIGTPGGSQIITTVLQNFLNMAIHGMNAQQAVAAPRFHHQWMPDQILVDPFSLSKDTISRLETIGHKVVVRSSYSGRSDNIFIDASGKRWGGADPRGEDAVRGF